ncbi:riboflavin biosynthesis protein RibD [Vibrio sp. 10N.286.49.B3]|uniref:bifunctional diaminohydroxyphosphoribosylaminopyrimidine deaminase/5-amino-6-(5-phosphoribosylamino)uracil reductase RibD n=1 Tax=Vibrio sp. 10N.286.49.B3 TaxID=1880855 RepID=UPI000C853631|nr:bifunctional diaminohydroxyphosphoribosylaminopyrimidine deaminase/5-amino-6-(5-phosphoribosylamino)uracil reductase RibD [Vibrio sp. 10N.286.49.B3]PMH41124.1 riboflavin biosynthesis protein RibD [Vibrio sp. 10N.286.49.B3]
MSEFTSIDQQMMSRAIQLAKRGIYTTAPNPNVGCVITKHGQIIGEGFHFKAGEPHAEVHALRMAGDDAQGATAYVTLEPCSHYGRTPPCAEGLIKANVTKVICAMTDPNPQVSGRGIQMLREAGIEVQVGLLESEAIALNPAFIKRMKTGMPFVQLKMAASLDGQTALNNGQSKWITASAARQDVQAFRAQAGAILSSSQTVIEDNASLNVRASDFPDWLSTQLEQDTYHNTSQALRQPVRIILDRQHKLSEGLALFNSEGEVLTVAESDADLLVACSDEGQLDLSQLLSQLATEQNINHIWVEAGATLASSLIKHNLVDELIVYLAPKLMGSDGRGLIGALGLTDMTQCIDLNITDIRLLGQDVRIRAVPATHSNF